VFIRFLKTYKKLGFPTNFPPLVLGDAPTKQMCRWNVKKSCDYESVNLQTLTGEYVSIS